jgi:hypothetical protein
MDQEKIVWEVICKLRSDFESAMMPVLSFEKFLFVCEQPPSEYELDWISFPLHALCHGAVEQFEKSISEVSRKHCSSVLEEIERKRRDRDAKEERNQKETGQEV